MFAHERGRAAPTWGWDWLGAWLCVIEEDKRGKEDAAVLGQEATVAAAHLSTT